MNTTKYLSQKVLLFCLTLALSATASAQLTTNRDGKLDRSFGTNGVSMLTLDPKNGDYFNEGDLTVTTDGKVVAVLVQSKTFGINNLIVKRLLENGQPDLTFGNNGEVLLTHFDSFGSTRVALQPDGKILLAGTKMSNTDLMVARLNQDGSVDKSFGTDGSYQLDLALPGESSLDRALTIHPKKDGKIIVAGLADRYVGSSPTRSFVVLLRLNSEGTLDSTFGNGVNMVEIGTQQFQSYQMGIGLESAVGKNGEIVLAAKQRKRVSIEPDVFGHFVNILKFAENGEPDQTFGLNGIVQFDDGNQSRVSGVHIYEKGKILVSSEIGMMRFLENGTLDTSFVFTSGVGNFFQIMGISVTPNGKIIAAVASLRTEIPTYLATLRRYYPDGDFDTKFRTSGDSIFRDSQELSAAVRMHLLPNNKVIVFGVHGEFPAARPFAAKYLISRKL